MTIQRQRSDDEEQSRLRLKSRLRTGDKSRTRQEKGEETNINHIMKTFGVNTPQRQGIYGQTIDYNMDLAAASGIVSEALEAYQRLPEKLKARYRTLEEFRKGLDSGQIKSADLQDPRQLALDLQREEERKIKERKETALDREKQDTDHQSLRERNKSPVDKETTTK